MAFEPWLAPSLPFTAHCDGSHPPGRFRLEHMALSSSICQLKAKIFSMMQQKMTLFFLLSYTKKFLWKKGFQVEKGNPNFLYRTSLEFLSLPTCSWDGREMLVSCPSRKESGIETAKKSHFGVRTNIKHWYQNYLCKGVKA